MKRKVCSLVAAASICCAGAVPADAQTARPARREKPFGYRALFDVGSHVFTASETFNTILETDRGTFLGGGAQARWKNLVFEVTGSRFRDTGERVFLFNGEVFRLGIPTTIEIRPIEFTTAYRLPRVWRFRPYAGGGFGKQRYRETSQFADSGENVSRTDTSYHVVGGAEIPIWRWIALGGEVRYRAVREAIGEGGVSKEFGESDLGGTSVRLRIIAVGR